MSGKEKKMCQRKFIYSKVLQTLQCNSSIEICRVNPKCNGSKGDESFKCVYCALKTNLLQLPVASRLLAKSNTSDDSSYDEYYEYDDEEISDKTEFDEDKEYLDDYIEPLDIKVDRSQRIRKFGACPKVVEAIGKCDSEKNLQPDCRFDTDCPGELKCCEAACGRRACNIPIQSKRIRKLYINEIIYSRTNFQHQYLFVRPHSNVL